MDDPIEVNDEVVVKINVVKVVLEKSIAAAVNHIETIKEVVVQTKEIEVWAQEAILDYNFVANNVREAIPRSVGASISEGFNISAILTKMVPVRAVIDNYLADVLELEENAEAD